MFANHLTCMSVFTVAMMRVQGKAKQLGDGHPVMGQIERVKLRYIKLR